MTYSYEGIGQVVATFMVNEPVAEGQIVKIAATGTVGPCAAGDAFCGKVKVAARDGLGCAVALRGLVTASYSGSTPNLGWCEMASDGSGGVSYKSGAHKYMVVDLNSDAKTVTFML